MKSAAFKYGEEMGEKMRRNNIRRSTDGACEINQVR